MLNSTVIVGKLSFVSPNIHSEFKMHEIGIRITNPTKTENEDEFVTINGWINQELYEKIELYALTGRTVGIKGHLTNKNYTNILLVNKFSFLN